MSTIIQSLRLPPGSTFDQPATTAGRQWKAALSYIAESRPQDWRCIVWGRKMEIPEEALLMIEWKTASHAEDFMQSLYHEFAALLAPLVQSLPEVSVAQLDCSICEPACVVPAGFTTAVIQLPFAAVNENEKISLIRSVQDYGASFDLEQQKGFADARCSWATPPVNAESSSRTLYLITRWESRGAEGEAESAHAHKTLLEPVIQKADSTWQKYHVSWEMLMPEFMGWWKDSESTCFPYKP